MAEENECHQHSRRFKKSFSFQAGKNRHGKTVNIGRQHSGGDKRGHIQSFFLQRVISSGDENPARPKYDQRGEQQGKQINSSVRKGKTYRQRSRQINAKNFLPQGRIKNDGYGQKERNNKTDSHLLFHLLG